MLDQFAGLAVALAAGLLIGVAFLLLIYKMIDGELPFINGFIGLCVLIFLLYNAVSPPHPAMPGVVFVVVLTCLALFPYAADQIEKAELRVMQTERLIRVYNAYVQKPDNVAAVFEITDRLYQHGMKGNAIAIASKTLQVLSQQVDPVQNRSLRDLFGREEALVKKWQRETASTPAALQPIPCPNCKTVNPLEELICSGCKRPYLLDIAAKMNLRPRVVGKLVFSFALIAASIVGSAVLGLHFAGVWLFVALFLALSITGSIVAWLFRPPRAK